MRTCLAVIAAFALSACDPAPEDKPTPTEVKVPGSKEISKEVATGVKDVLADKGPKWTITYSGGMSGEISGNIMTAMVMGPNTTVAGRGMNADKTGSAPAGFSATITKGGDKPTAMLRMTLADGTKCRITSGSVDGKETVKIINPDAKEFQAELTGKLGCGDDKKIVSYKAVLKK